MNDQRDPYEQYDRDLDRDREKDALWVLSWLTIIAITILVVLGFLSYQVFLAFSR